MQGVAASGEPPIEACDAIVIIAAAAALPSPAGRRSPCLPACHLDSGDVQGEDLQDNMASPSESPNEKIVVGEGKFSSPDVKLSNTGQPRQSFTENVSRKRMTSEDIEGPTALNKLPTPINLFKDECAFCHSFRRSPFHGPMIRCVEGRILSIDDNNSSNGIYVHEKCLEWTPEIYFKGDIVMKLESAVRRASRLRCHRCGLQGAALGCFYNDCKRNFHVPCAVQILECLWDVIIIMYCVLNMCQRHYRAKSWTYKQRRSCTNKGDNPDLVIPQEGHQHVRAREKNKQRRMKILLPCSRVKIQTRKEALTIAKGKIKNRSDYTDTSISYLLPQSRDSNKKGNSNDCERENQQTDHLNTSDSSLLPQSHCSWKKGISIDSSREAQQMDQLSTSSSSLPQGHCSQKKGISIDSSREAQQMDQLSTSSSSLPQGVLRDYSQHLDDEAISKNQARDNKSTGDLSTSRIYHPDEKAGSIACQAEEIEVNEIDTSSCPSDQLVLLGSSLSASEKDFLQKFASWTDASVTKEWSKNVTHVIVGKGSCSTWSRSYEVLMAILRGKWIVQFEWIVDSLELRPDSEASYEVTFIDDSFRTIDGPKKGRIAAAEGAPKLFSGLHFCLSAYMNLEDRHQMQDLIAAGGGQILGRDNPHSAHKSSNDSSAKFYFVYDGGAPREFTQSSLLDLRKEAAEAKELAASGAQVIGHFRVLDAIAAYDVKILDESSAVCT
ncbi:hypothetical protein ACP4OV_028761 [Aristida adscensionis]